MQTDSWYLENFPPIKIIQIWPNNHPFQSSNETLSFISSPQFRTLHITLQSGATNHRNSTPRSTFFSQHRLFFHTYPHSIALAYNKRLKSATLRPSISSRLGNIHPLSGYYHPVYPASRVKPCHNIPSVVITAHSNGHYTTDTVCTNAFRIIPLYWYLKRCIIINVPSIIKKQITDRIYTVGIPSQMAPSN